MKLAHRLILAFALMAGIAPAIAQPAPVPALPDAERRTAYTINASNCACAVNFALYGDSTDYQNWVEVWLNGVRANYNDPVFSWTITSPSGSLSILARPITDAVLTFTIPQTGTVQIVGARRPRRISQYAENNGVPTRNFNRDLTDIIAQNREFWDKMNDVTGRSVMAPPGETLAVLPQLSGRASMGACFDSSGNLTPCVSSSSGSFAAGSGIQFTGTNPTTISVNATNTVATIESQGRLTLTSGAPVMSTSVVGATSIIYTPYVGNLVVLFNGTNLVQTPFPEVSQALSDTTKSPAAAVLNTVYDIVCWSDSGTPRCTRSYAWTNDTTLCANCGRTIVAGIALNTTAITNGPGALLGTIIGTIRTNASATVDYSFGAIASGVTSASFGVWNLYNRLPVTTYIGDTTGWSCCTSGAGSANTWRAANANNNFRISFVRGFALDGQEATYNALGTAGATTNMTSGIGYDNTIPLIPCGTTGFNNVPTTTATLPAVCRNTPAAGYHFYQAIELNSSTTASTWYAQQLSGGGVVEFQSGLQATLYQ